MCGTITFKEGQHEYKIDCGGKNGSVVTVHNPKEYLQVCELRVFGELTHQLFLEYSNLVINDLLWHTVQ